MGTGGSVSAVDLHPAFFLFVWVFFKAKYTTTSV